jgi:transcription elongation factor Elf1
MIGTCPKCEGMISVVNANPIEINVNGRLLKGVSYACQGCNSVLSVEIDPLAVKADIVSAISKVLGKG